MAFIKYTKTNITQVYPGTSRAGVNVIPYNSNLSRMRQRNALAMRLYLHHLANEHVKMYLVTFTYNENTVPCFNLSNGMVQRGQFYSSTRNSRHDVVPCFAPRDWQLFMKRVRKWYATSENPLDVEHVKDIKYMAVGEFGTDLAKTMRSHIHAAIFMPAHIPFDEIRCVFERCWYLEGDPSKSLGNIDFAESKFEVGNYEVKEYPGFSYAGKYARKGQLLKNHPHYKYVADVAPHLLQRYMKYARFFCISHGLADNWQNIPGLDVDDVLLHGLPVTYKTKKSIVTKRIPIPSICVHKFFFKDEYRFVYPESIRVMSASEFWSQLSLVRDVFVPWLVRDRWHQYIVQGDYTCPFIVPRGTFGDKIVFVVQDDAFDKYISKLGFFVRKSFLRPHLRTKYRKYVYNSIHEECRMLSLDPLVHIPYDYLESYVLYKKIGYVYFDKTFITRLVSTVYDGVTMLNALRVLLDTHLEGLRISSENYHEFFSTSIKYDVPVTDNVKAPSEFYEFEYLDKLLRLTLDNQAYNANENSKKIEKDYEEIKRARALYYRY